MTGRAAIRPGTARAAAIAPRHAVPTTAGRPGICAPVKEPMSVPAPSDASRRATVPPSPCSTEAVYSGMTTKTAVVKRLAAVKQSRMPRTYGMAPSS